MLDEQDADALVTFDWTTFDSPSTAVITAVAEESGDDPVALDPLYDVIDPDSLDQLLTSTRYSLGSPRGSVKFAYHDYWVVVNANGRGYVHDSKDRPRTTTATPLAELANEAE